MRETLKSVSHRCYIFEVAFVWEVTEETIHLPMGCLQGGVGGVEVVLRRGHYEAPLSLPGEGGGAGAGTREKERGREKKRGIERERGNEMERGREMERERTRADPELLASVLCCNIIHGALPYTYMGTLLMRKSPPPLGPP